MPAAWSARVLSELKRVRPANVIAVLLDGSEAPVALGKGRQIWAPAMRVLEEITWDRLKLLDEKGKLKAMVSCNESATDIGEAPPRSRVGSELYDLVRVMLEAQRVALGSVFDLLKPILDVNRQMIHDLHGQAVIARKQASTAADNANELAERLERANAARAAGDEQGFASEMAHVAKMIPIFLQAAEALGIVRPAPARTKPAPPKNAPPNGHNGSNGQEAA